MLKSHDRLDSRELSALVISAAIFFATVCYWIAQIDGVRTMLKLAHP